MKKILQCGLLLFLASILTYVWSSKFVGSFPATSDIHPALKNAPFQGETSEPPFTFEYHDTRYIVEPVASYELSGLIVSHNNISSITDAYHTSSSVDFRDLCVVWGQNAKKDLLDQMTFWSEPWTCWYKTNTPDADGRFFGDEFSNSHLLSDNEEVRELVKTAQVGDQIQLNGFLVNYAVENMPQQTRDSSLVRYDTGNGACEVIFVNEAKILRTANGAWRLANTVSYGMFFILLLILPIAWVWQVQLRYHRAKVDLEERLKKSPHLRHKGL